MEVPLESPLRWGELQIAVQNFIKSQMIQARQLRKHELCHIQTMIFLPRWFFQLMGNTRLQGG